MIAYEDVLNSSGMDAFLNERRQRYFQKALLFCRAQFPGRFAPIDDNDGLVHIEITFGVAKSFGLRSERDNLKLLIATAHWGLGFATDPRLGHRMVECDWLDPNLYARRHVKLSRLLRAVDGWHHAVRPEDRVWAEAVANVAGMIMNNLTGMDALYAADSVWQVGTRQMPQHAWTSYATALEADRAQLALDGRLLVLHALLGLRFGYRYLYEPTLPALAAALRNEGTQAQRFDALMQAALAVPPMLKDAICHKT